MDLKALEGKSHQLVSSLAFETCFLALTFSSPKKILDLSHGSVSSSSRVLVPWGQHQFFFSCDCVAIMGHEEGVVLELSHPRGGRICFLDLP